MLLVERTVHTFLHAAFTAHQHRVVLRRQRDHHRRILRALALMHGGRIGERHLIELSDVIRHFATLKADYDFPVLQIDPHNLPDVAVKGIFVVVVDGLDDLVARGIAPTKAGHRGRGIGIEGLLKRHIERACPQTAAVHRRGGQSAAECAR